MGFFNGDVGDIDKLEEENEKLDQQVSIEEKRRIIAEAKAKHGKDWFRFLTDAKSGIDWNAVKFKLQQ